MNTKYATLVVGTWLLLARAREAEAAAPLPLRSESGAVKSNHSTLYPF